MADPLQPVTLCPLQTYDLTKTQWSLRRKGDPPENDLPCTIPTNVHLDLLAHDRIPDPFVGYNEREVQWVSSQEWSYKTTLPRVANLRDNTKVVLVFDGLDTHAIANLNGHDILRCDNQFISHRVDITGLLKGDGTDALTIYFFDAHKAGMEVVKRHPEHKWVLANGDASRLAVRKAQYHWGWDWGPKLITCGPWKPIRLETYHARIADLWTEIEVPESLTSAKIIIRARVEGSCHDAYVLIDAELEGVSVAKHHCKVIKDGTISCAFKTKPKLWWPRGYGSQPLYTISATLIQSGVQLHKVTRRVGIRRAELVQREDSHGKSFFFRINNVDIFGAGTNWIPADSFTPRITKEKFRRWIDLAPGCMIRVWGGGIWESDDFYDLCDEQGLLVWQDFMFACGNYPAHKDMLKSIRVECETQLKRLRHHPSIVLFAGNNEDYQIQEQFKLTYNYADKNPDNWLKTDFPARYIYEKLLPDAVETFFPGVAYHPGSPWGDGKPSYYTNTGDVHAWSVWHGAQEKYQTYHQLGGRFNSEFGMEAFPHVQTLQSFASSEDDLHPQSQLQDFHNKADGHERRIATYIAENFQWRGDVQGLIHLTQLMQSEAMQYAYRGFRKQWGDERKCGGALCWLLNDCWPATSWSLVDYFLRKKPAWYTIQRCLRPLAVGVQRAHHDWSVPNQPPPSSSAFCVWVASTLLEEAVVDVEVRFVSVATGEEVRERKVKRSIRIQENGTTEVLHGRISNEADGPQVVAARIFHPGEDEVLARDIDWPQPLKYLSFEDRGLEVESEGQGVLRITAKKPVKGLVFEERDGVELSDNCLDVAPGDVYRIFVRGLNKGDAPLSWRHLGSG